MAQDYTTDCRRLVTELRPRSILCVGLPCESVLGDGCCAGTALEQLPLEEIGRLGELGAFDLIFVAEALEHLDRNAALHLLARLRDLHGGRLVVVMPAEAGPRDRNRGLWTMEDFLSMGLRLHARYGSGSGERHLYMFDIGSYKQTPDWLNPRFWANPERWDKDWW